MVVTYSSSKSLLAAKETSKILKTYVPIPPLLKSNIANSLTNYTHYNYQQKQFRSFSFFYPTKEEKNESISKSKKEQIPL